MINVPSLSANGVPLRVERAANKTRYLVIFPCILLTFLCSVFRRTVTDISSLNVQCPHNLWSNFMCTLYETVRERSRRNEKVVVVLVIALRSVGTINYLFSYRRNDGPPKRESVIMVKEKETLKLIYSTILRNLGVSQYRQSLHSYISAVCNIFHFGTHVSLFIGGGTGTQKIYTRMVG